MTDAFVINSNHDFYWEGGKPASERNNEHHGPRDHFFKNIDNKAFFSLFKKIYPWNGKRWGQVNINSQQSDVLAEKFEFDHSSLFELSTSISDNFFKPYTPEDVKTCRLTMAHILSGGYPEIITADVKEHLRSLDSWIFNQMPIVCGCRSGITIDITNDKTIYCLQPTRIIARKRIEKDVQLIEKLLHYPPFIKEFKSDKNYQIVLHITGPMPIEHKHDKEIILQAYIDMLEKLPSEVAERVFIAFSVGNEDHESLKPAGLKRLHIEEIYRLATVILFPSETEGRGLPIIEASACGIPIICSHYYPYDVFDEVVGTNLPDEQKIKFILFQEEGYPEDFLNTVSDLMFSKNLKNHIAEHNKRAVKIRYSTKVLEENFREIFDSIFEKLHK